MFIIKILFYMVHLFKTLSFNKKKLRSDWIFMQENPPQLQTMYKGYVGGYLKEA